MTKSLTSRNDVRLLLIASLGDQLGKPVFRQVCKWEQSSGPEWTVKRLKAIRVAALQSRGGNFNEAKQAMLECSIKFKNTPLGPIPKGIWGPVVYRFLSAQKPSIIKRISLALRVYTAIFLETVSSSQYRKAFKAILARPAIVQKIHSRDISSGLSWELWDLNITNGLFWAYSQRACKLLDIHPGKLELQPPNLQRLKPFSSYYRTPGSTPPGDGAYNKMVASMLTQVYLPKSLQAINPLEDMRLTLINQDPANDVIPGKIEFLQEAGAKARVIAIPNFWLQFLFEPLHGALDKFISHLPNSCVHDQVAGGWFLDSQIRDSKYCWCFDLSSATDRFPRLYQLEILRWFGLDLYAEALEEVCNAPWQFPNNHKDLKGTKGIRYRVGQPMGLYASFPLFHLTHYVLLVMCSLKHGYTELKRMPFVVLGDDVVITDGDVAEEYSSWLSDWEVEHLGPKSITSNSVGEFAGFLSIKTRKGSVTFRPYKFGRPKHGFGDKAIPLLASLGNNCQLLGPPWDKIQRLYSKTIEWRDLDLTSLIHARPPWFLRPRPVTSDFIGSVVNNITGRYVDAPRLFEGVQHLPRPWRLHSLENSIDTGVFESGIQSDHVFLEHDISIPKVRSNYQTEQDLLQRISADPLLADQRSL